MSQIKKYIKYLKDYRIHILPGHQFQGIKDTLMGWAIVGFAIIFTEPVTDPIALEFSFIFVYLTGAIFILLCVLFDSVLMGNGFQDIKTLLISSSTDKSPVQAHLTANQRIKSIYFRGFLATTNFIALNTAKMYFDAVDNSAIFGADALVFVILSAWVLGTKINLKEWIGIFIACAGVFTILAFDVSSFNWKSGLFSAAAGIYSAITFSIIFFITSIIVRHDSPKRVVFHQCIMGFIMSLIAFVLTLAFMKHPEGKNIFSNITLNIFRNSIILGVLYALALYRFLRAFLFAEPAIIAVMGYSLFVFVIFFDFFFQNGAIITWRNIISSLLITFGCAMLLYEEHRKGKGLSKKPKISKPIYSEKNVPENFD